MKGNFRKATWTLCLSFLFLLLPAAASATPITVHAGQVVTLGSLMTAGDVVLCDPGLASCNANTPRADIAGVGSFYLSYLGPYTPDIGPDANTVTFLTGSSLANFLNNYPGGFSANAVFTDASANGNTSFGNFVFSNMAWSATPEPATFVLLSIGLLAIGGAYLRHSAQA
ncbi:MAG: PEP-CTERM sorting domain-containing protein [Candidatus Acidiferrales bacterium]